MCVWMCAHNNAPGLVVRESPLLRSGIPTASSQHACQVLSEWDFRHTLWRSPAFQGCCQSYLGSQLVREAGKTHLCLLQELGNAEKAYRDVCDQIAKAERFFPLTGGARSEAAAHQQGQPCRGQHGHPRALVEAQASTP